MSKPQDFIDALRSGDYNKAIKLVDYVQEKYQANKNGFDNDTMVALLTYELCHTDINADDITKLSFFYNYLSYNNALPGLVDIKITLLADASNQARLLNKEASLPTLLEGLNLINDNYDELDESSNKINEVSLKKFMDADSPFSQLVAAINQNQSEQILNNPITENEVFNKINAMDKNIFSTFQNSMEIFKQENQLPFDCIFISQLHTIKEKAEQQTKRLDSFQQFKKDFQLIRDRSFLSKLDEQIQQKTPEQIAKNLHSCQNLIFINKKSLREHFIEHFKIDISNKNSEQINAELSQYLEINKDPNKTFETIVTIYKEQIFNDISNEVEKDILARTLISTTFEHGLFFVLENALVDAAAGKKYTPVTNSTVSIQTTNDGFYIDEQCHLMQLQSINAEGKHEIHSFKSGNPLMELNNRFDFCVVEEGNEKHLDYAHTDLTIGYNDPLCETLFDKRSILDKVIDFFKSVFMLNDIPERHDERPSNVASI